MAAERGRRPIGVRAAALVVVPLVALLAGACGGPAAESGAAITGLQVRDDGMHGSVLTAPHVLADEVLTDTAGADYDLRADTTAPVTLVFFGYTHCPDVCLLVMADIAAALQRLPEDLAAQVDLLLVTSDPARDDPATLRTYLDRYDPGFEGLTAPLPVVERVARSLRVGMEQEPRLPSGGYEVTHGASVIGVLPDGTAPVIWTEGVSAAQLAEDLHLLLTDGLPTTSQGR